MLLQIVAELKARPSSVRQSAELEALLSKLDADVRHAMLRAQAANLAPHQRLEERTAILQKNFARIVELLNEPAGSSPSPAGSPLAMGHASPPGLGAAVTSSPLATTAHPWSGGAYPDHRLRPARSPPSPGAPNSYPSVTGDGAPATPSGGGNGAASGAPNGAAAAAAIEIEALKTRLRESDAALAEQTEARAAAEQAAAAEHELARRALKERLGKWERRQAELEESLAVERRQREAAAFTADAIKTAAAEDVSRTHNAPHIPHQRRTAHKPQTKCAHARKTCTRVLRILRARHPSRGLPHPSPPRLRTWVIHTLGGGTRARARCTDIPAVGEPARDGAAQRAHPYRARARG